jgi:hypothetical protein
MAWRAIRRCFALFVPFALLVALFFELGVGFTSVPAHAAPATEPGSPTWWDGDCDANHWNALAAAQGWTGPGAHRLGAAYLGVPVCGPRRSGDFAPTVQWSRPGWGHFEWECVELAMRFMAQIYGVKGYGANGNQVVSNYLPSYGGGLQRVDNGTPGAAPQPGDVISFDNPSTGPVRAGHAAVVVSSSVDINGNGSIMLMSQNDTVDGWRRLTVTNWVVGGFGAQIATAWLHDPLGRGASYANVTLPEGDGPAVASAQPGQTDVFVRGSDDALWTRHRNGTTWGGWTSLGGILTAAPAAASPQQGVIDLFVRGRDNALWTNHSVNGSWSGWASLGGILTSPPAAASPQQGVLDLFVRGRDNALWTNHAVNGVWSGWATLGGLLLSAPGATSGGPGALDLFVRGSDNAVWTRHLGAWGWAPWQPLGGLVTTRPMAGSGSAGSVDLYVRGTDNAVWTRHATNGVWGQWSSLGWIVTSPVAPVANGLGGLDLFARGIDYSLWTARMTNSTFGAPASVGGLLQ